VINNPALAGHLKTEHPDFFASRGVSLLLNSLKMWIEPHPTPQIAVFMNKTKTYGLHPVWMTPT